MRKTSEVCEMIPAKLVRSVVRQIGDKGSLEDVANHGADAGYYGFTYYSDTVPFFKRNRKEIVELAERMASYFGQNVADMVAGFNCLAGSKGDKSEYMPSVCRCLYGGKLKDDDTIVANALAWFALEEVARAFCDE